MDVILNLLSNIFETFFDVILNILSLLPMSPFANLVEKLVGFEFLGYMNYFVPFQGMATILNVYIGALFTYYVFKYVYKVTDKLQSLKGLF